MNLLKKFHHLYLKKSEQAMNETLNYFDLYKAKNYSKVVEDLLPSALAGQGFDTRNLNVLIDSLNKLKRYEEAATIGKKFVSEVLQNTYALGNFCFSVYMAKFQPHLKEEIIKPETIKTAEWLISHAKKDPTNFIYLNPLLMVVEYNISKQNFGKAKELLSGIIPGQLKTDRTEITVDGKKITLKSDKMKFLKLQYDVAKAEKEFETALQIIDQLVEIDPWDIWFKREKAIILSETGHHNESMNLYLELLERKKEWFLYHEVAKLAQKINLPEKAQKFFAKAFISGDRQGPLFTWHLYIEIADFLKSNGRQEEANWHLDYIFHSALTEDGNKPQEMLKYFHFSGYKPDSEPDIPALRKKLLDFHTEFQFEGQQFEGVISKMNEGGKSGFVTSENKKYFFSSRDFKGKAPTEGMVVSFYTETKLNRKTNKEEDHAVGLVVKK